MSKDHVKRFNEKVVGLVNEAKQALSDEEFAEFLAYVTEGARVHLADLSSLDARIQRERPRKRC